MRSNSPHATYLCTTTWSAWQHIQFPSVSTKRFLQKAVLCVLVEMNTKGIHILITLFDLSFRRVGNVLNFITWNYNSLGELLVYMNLHSFCKPSLPIPSIFMQCLNYDLKTIDFVNIIAYYKSYLSPNKGKRNR